MVVVLGCALGVGVKVAQGIDFIAEEFDARGGEIGGRPDIQNAAAPGKLPRFDNRCGGFVPQIYPVASELVGQDDLFGFDALHGFDKLAPRQCARHGGARRANDDRRGSRIAPQSRDHL